AATEMLVSPPLPSVPLPLSHFASVNCQFAGSVSATLYVVPGVTAKPFESPSLSEKVWGRVSAPGGCGVGPLTVNPNSVVTSGDGTVAFRTTRLPSDVGARRWSRY